MNRLRASSWLIVLTITLSTTTRRRVLLACCANSPWRRGASLRRASIWTFPGCSLPRGECLSASCASVINLSKTNFLSPQLAQLHALSLSPRRSLRRRLQPTRAIALVVAHSPSSRHCGVWVPRAGVTASSPATVPMPSVSHNRLPLTVHCADPLFISSPYSSPVCSRLAQCRHAAVEAGDSCVAVILVPSVIACAHHRRHQLSVPT